MKFISLIFVLLLFPLALIAQILPSEQLVLYKVWSSDSSALKNLGYGDYVFSQCDTVVLEGSDTDTLEFYLPDSRGYFIAWLIPDTANFRVGGISHNHLIGQTDSLTLSYRPKMRLNQTTANPAIQMDYLKNLDWEAEQAYYETFTPPLSQYLEFYLQHTGTGDTSAVILEIHWQ
jgi:hypothetical protein